MKKTMLLFLLLPVCAFAVETTDCSTASQLAALYQVRAVMIRSSSSYDTNKFIDAKLDELRVPLSGGGYRWVRWARPSGSPEYDKKGHTVAAVQGSGSDNFEASGDHVFAVRVAVPSKRSTFSGNNAVYVGTVHIRAVANGRTRNIDEHIDNWMNRDTTKTIDLNMIADRVDVSLDASAKPDRANESLVEIHLLKAAAEDDPANPNYETITTLRRVRDSWDSDTIDDEIARLNPDESLPLYHIVRELRRADDLIHSKKEEDHEKGERLMKEMLRRLR